MTVSKRRYGESWRGAAFCLVAFSVWVIVPALVSLQVGAMSTSARLAAQHITGILILGPLYLLQSRYFQGLGGRGAISRRAYVTGLTAVAALYAISEIIEWVQGIPLEPWLSFVTNADLSQLIFIALLAIVVAPISEELAFRHFLLAALPFKRNRFYTVSAVLVGATVFMLMHSYEFWVTNVLMFLLAVVFAIARIKTGGLLLPILLHGAAGALGMTIILIRS